MADIRTPVTVVGAPELKDIPDSFWQRFARFLREGLTGQITFSVGKGHVTALDAHERHNRSDVDER